MCGIAGGFGLERGTLSQMAEAIRHRGPDDDGFYFDPPVGLANRRLSIIDLSTGKQPIVNEDQSCWIVFNGEIYNYQKLRQELIQKSHRFTTNSDTETILHLYEEEGVECVRRLDGMFAFVIWDARNRQLFAARDPLGKKPFHWAVVDGNFVFASEIKSILEVPGFAKEIDRQALAKYFLFGYVPAPQTIFKDIRKLLPGYWMTVSEAGEVEERQFWKLGRGGFRSDLKKGRTSASASWRTKVRPFEGPTFRAVPHTSEREIKQQVTRLLSAAVEKRLVSDVPLGVFLSGGVDSSLVAALMSQLVDPTQIQAFSIGFDERGFDESQYAVAVAQHLGVKHHLKTFSPREVLSLVPRLAEVLDEPMADPSILPTFLLSKYTREEVKVALSGDGGDEVFAGYPKYLAHWFLEQSRLDKLPLHWLAEFLPGKLGPFARYANYPLHQRNQLWVSQFSPEEARSLTGWEGDLLEDAERYHQTSRFGRSDLSAKRSKRSDLKPLNEALFLDLKMNLPDLYLVKTDRASMAASLEVRCPFLDKELVEFGMQIPFQMKLKGFRTKQLLKKIAAEFLPREVVFRPKMGFGIPLRDWLRNELRPLLTAELAPAKIRQEGLLDAGWLRGNAARLTPNQLWSLLVFELWFRRWM